MNSVWDNILDAMVDRATKELEPIRHEYPKGVRFERVDSAVVDLDGPRFLEAFPSGVAPEYVGDFRFENLGHRKYRITRMGKDV